MKTEDKIAPAAEAVMELLLPLVAATERRRALKVLEVCRSNSEVLELFELLRKALRVALATSEKESDSAAPAPRKTPMELLSECATATEAARFVELMRLFEPGELMAKCRTASEAQSLAKALMDAQDFARFSSGARSFRAAAAPSQAEPSSDSTSPGRTPG